MISLAPQVFRPVFDKLHQFPSDHRAAGNLPRYIGAMHFFFEMIDYEFHFLPSNSPPRLEDTGLSVNNRRKWPFGFAIRARIRCLLSAGYPDRLLAEVSNICHWNELLERVRDIAIGIFVNS